MAPRWIHEFFDILTFGRSYWMMHKKIDKAYETLKWEHRKVEHEYYLMFKQRSVTEFLVNIPQLASSAKNVYEGVKLAHCLVDRMWDELSPEEREGWACVFHRMILEEQVKCMPRHWKDCQELMNYIRNKTIGELL